MLDAATAHTHALADLEELRVRYIQTLRLTIDQLTDLPIALNRTNPKIAPSIAVLNEVLADLQKTLNQLH